ncbi:hypothetical protein [Actinacidiphila acidipaludis]|uniref:ATP-binding protein n=1 Tax=Actinacidiphila acidipaludis TaxID=2873382 RepID=A0ABS7Q339_9ACTN|nr:hypothetical protein [Streptomyces acidipaludis]MBY8877566.1 hypothetical protein [Streptomyces acidipaludis]
MKYSKMAAAVAGSVIAVGVGAPAFAADSTAATPMMPTSINGGVDELLAAQPLQKVVEGTHLDHALQSADRTTDSLQGQAKPDGLVGQAVDTARGTALPAVGQVVPGASLLGGLPLNGLPLGGLPLGGLPLGG